MTTLNIIQVQNLAAVVIPLVRLLADGDLSWGDREHVARAIDATRKQWDAMETERRMLSQQSLQGGTHTR